jgi:hypothetical protein
VETCCVVWGNDCKAPANMDPPEPARATCFACGLAVCTACSRRIPWWSHGVRRVCFNCSPPD